VQFSSAKGGEYLLREIDIQLMPAFVAGSIIFNTKNIVNNRKQTLKQVI